MTRLILTQDNRNSVNGTGGLGTARPPAAVAGPRGTSKRGSAGGRAVRSGRVLDPDRMLLQPGAVKPRSGTGQDRYHESEARQGGPPGQQLAERGRRPDVIQLAELRHGARDLRRGE